MLEKYLIEHCAPTLASIKTASLFCLPLIAERELEHQIQLWNGCFAEKGLFLTVLSRKGGRALVYVCRRAHLERDLQKRGVASFLAQYGYLCVELDAALARLKQRLGEQDGFPHEIGIFLGYPLGDVIGFIQNEGRNCKCAGCWKVYCDAHEAGKIFARYRKCREIYARLWRGGKSIVQLTVAA